MRAEYSQWLLRSNSSCGMAVKRQGAHEHVLCAGMQSCCNTYAMQTSNSTHIEERFIQLCRTTSKLAAAAIVCTTLGLPGCGDILEDAQPPSMPISTTYAMICCVTAVVCSESKMARAAGHLRCRAACGGSASL